MQREVQIVSKLGLHARPAAEFVKCVTKFKSKVTLCRDGERFSATSILEVLTANLDCGASVVLEDELVRRSVDRYLRISPLWRFAHWIRIAFDSV